MKRLLTSHWFLLIGLVAVALVVRLYDLKTPLADWHSWRQADTVSVTREYIKHDYDILHPHYQDLSDIPNGLNNIQGYRMVEFPLINYPLAQLILKFPKLDLVVTSRLVSIGFSLISVAGLYIVVQMLSKKKFIAFASAAVFALIPYSIYYSRTTLPEPAIVAFQLLALVFLLMWVNAIKKNAKLPVRLGWIFLATLSFACALLLKPFAIFFAPVLMLIVFWELGLQTFLLPEIYFFPIFSIVPLMWWRHWITQYPSGIPASDWLFNGNGIRFRPAWWRWLFADRIGRLIMGYWGVVFLFLGTVIREGKKRLSLFDAVSILWLLGMFAYLVVVATGNVQHDYYQVMLTPIIAILFGRGVWSVHALAKNSASPLIIYPTAILVLLLTTMFSWNEVSGYYNINHP